MQASRRLFSTATRRVVNNKQNIEKVSKTIKTKKSEPIYDFEKGLGMGGVTGLVAGSIGAVSEINKRDNPVDVAFKIFMIPIIGCCGGALVGMSWPVSVPLITAAGIKYAFIH